MNLKSSTTPPPKRTGKLGIFALIVGCLVLGVAATLWVKNRSNEVSDSTSPQQTQTTSQTRTPVSEEKETATLAKADLDLHPNLKNLKYDATIRKIAEREDPVVDGWDSERFSELADGQLKQIGKLLSDEKLIDPDHVSAMSTNDCQAPLRPTKLASAFDDNTIHVLRSDRASTPQSFADALTDHAKLFSNADDSRFKFKIISVNLDSNTATTRSYFQMIAYARQPWKHETIGDVERVQVNSTWDCIWDTTDKAAPKLKEVTATDYEEVYSKTAQLFVDCTESQFVGIDALQEQLVHGRDHWYGNLESSIGVEGRGNGLAIGDANGDGLEDIYICQPAALPNKLMLRKPDGSFEDASARAGVDWLDSSRGALFVDLDNDGDQDLVVAIDSEVVLHENDGQGKFTRRNSIQTNSRLFSLNALDYDRDGKLDLYVCGYSGANQIRPEDIFASPVPYHDANNGAENLLLRQTNAWAFSDVTKEVGLSQNNLRFSLASTWDDMDGDGDLDLYVANDFGRNNLYRNDNGKFVDVAETAGVEDIGPGMSCAWGDYNNDGKIDLYVSNMFSSAGSRITHDPKFKPDARADDLAGFQRHARGNTLFENNGDGTFSDRAIESGTTMGRWAWGSLLVDINNDGHRDVYVANGFVTADNNNDL